MPYRQTAKIETVTATAEKATETVTKTKETNRNGNKPKNPLYLFPDSQSLSCSTLLSFFQVNVMSAGEVEAARQDRIRSLLRRAIWVLGS